MLFMLVCPVLLRERHLGEKAKKAHRSEKFFC